MNKYKYSSKSRATLATCHIDLQRLFNEVIKYYDCSIICGYRNKAEQNKAFESGKSKLRYPQSKHNKTPSMAVDAILYPIKWDDKGRNYIFVGVVLEMARRLGIEIRCGADWNGNLRTNDQSFHDVVHFELVEAKNG